MPSHQDILDFRVHIVVTDQDTYITSLCTSLVDSGRSASFGRSPSHIDYARVIRVRAYGISSYLVDISAAPLPVLVSAFASPSCLTIEFIAVYFYLVLPVVA
jgi:hypothetical protein